MVDFLHVVNVQFVVIHFRFSFIYRFLIVIVFLGCYILNQLKYCDIIFNAYGYLHFLKESEHKVFDQKENVIFSYDSIHSIHHRRTSKPYYLDRRIIVGSWLIKWSFTELGADPTNAISRELQIWRKLSSRSFNPLAPGRCKLKLVIFKLKSRLNILSISCEITLRWIQQDLIDDKSALVQVMAWCHQATSHCLNHCRPRFVLPYGISGPQWVDISRSKPIKILHISRWHKCHCSKSNFRDNISMA